MTLQISCNVTDHMIELVVSPHIQSCLRFLHLHSRLNLIESLIESFAVYPLLQVLRCSRIFCISLHTFLVYIYSVENVGQNVLLIRTSKWKVQRARKSFKLYPCYFGFYAFRGIFLVLLIHNSNSSVACCLTRNKSSSMTSFQTWRTHNLWLGLRLKFTKRPGWAHVGLP